jgi:hypothetical protein
MVDAAVCTSALGFMNRCSDYRSSRGVAIQYCLPSMLPGKASAQLESKMHENTKSFISNFKMSWKWR